jgi:hypothetical protein
MHGDFDNLNSGIVTGLDVGAGRQRDLRDAHGAGVWVLARSKELKERHHWIGHVRRAIVWAIRSKAQINVEEGLSMALEPARLEGYGAACCRPKCPVRRRPHATT